MNIKLRDLSPSELEIVYKESPKFMLEHFFTWVAEHDPQYAAISDMSRTVLLRPGWMNLHYHDWVRTHAYHVVGIDHTDDDGFKAHQCTHTNVDIPDNIAMLITRLRANTPEETDDVTMATLSDDEVKKLIDAKPKLMAEEFPEITFHVRPHLLSMHNPEWLMQFAPSYLAGLNSEYVAKTDPDYMMEYDPMYMYHNHREVYDSANNEWTILNVEEPLTHELLKVLEND